MKRTTWFLALLGALIASPVAAQAPNISIGFVDNLDGSVTLQITPDGSLLPGSIATELGVESVISASDGLTLTGATLVDPTLFEFELPGANPFAGGAVTLGLDLNNLASNQIFASFGSNIISDPGPVDFLNITFTGAGRIEASGLVAQAGATTFGLSANIDVVPEPTAAVLALLGFPAAFGRRRGR